MKRIVLLLLIPLALASCATQRAYNKATRNLERLQRTLREHPELADSLQIVTRDTTKTAPLQAKIVIQPVVDSAAVDSLARVLCSQLHQAEQPPPGPHQAPTMPRKSNEQLRQELARELCPEVIKDTTLVVRIYNDRWSKDLPMNLSIKSFAGRLQMDVAVQAIQIPETQIKTEVRIAPKPPFYKDLWFWLFAAVLVLFALVSTRR